MLEISLLDEGIKVIVLGCLLETCHPFLLLLKASLTMIDFFKPDRASKVDPVINQAVTLLKKCREGLWKAEAAVGNRAFLMKVNGSC